MWMMSEKMAVKFTMVEATACDRRLLDREGVDEMMIGGDS